MCYFKIIIKNCLWSPLVLAKYQPSFFNICKTSLTLYFFISLNVLITQAKVRIIILSSKYLALKVLKPVGTFYRFTSKNPLNPIGCGFEILLVL